MSPYTIPGQPRPHEKVIELVTEVTGISYDQMRDKGRGWKPSYARQLVYFILTNSIELGEHYNHFRLGKMFDRMRKGKPSLVDHSSVITGIKKAEGFYEVDDVFRSQVDDITAKCGLHLNAKPEARKRA